MAVFLYALRFDGYISYPRCRSEAERRLPQWQISQHRQIAPKLLISLRVLSRAS